MRKIIFILFTCLSLHSVAKPLVYAVQVVTDYTSAQETTLAGTLSGKPANYRVIFNTTLGKGRYWNGSAFVDLPSLSASNIPTTLSTTGAITSSGAGIGYITGAGGTVTQLTSRTTGVTLNKLCGDITMFSAAQAAQALVTFTFTNSFIASTDKVVINHRSTTNGGAWGISIVEGSGSCTISIRNLSTASITEATPLRFTIIKGSTN